MQEHWYLNGDRNYNTSSHTTNRYHVDSRESSYSGSSEDIRGTTALTSQGKVLSHNGNMNTIPFDYDNNNQTNHNRSFMHANSTGNFFHSGDEMNNSSRLPGWGQSGLFGGSNAVIDSKGRNNQGSDSYDSLSDIFSSHSVYRNNSTLSTDKNSRYNASDDYLSNQVPPTNTNGGISHRNGRSISQPSVGFSYDDLGLSEDFDKMYVAPQRSSSAGLIGQTKGNQTQMTSFDISNSTDVSQRDTFPGLLSREGYRQPHVISSSSNLSQYDQTGSDYTTTGRVEPDQQRLLPQRFHHQPPTISSYHNRHPEHYNSTIPIQSSYEIDQTSNTSSYRIENNAMHMHQTSSNSQTPVMYSNPSPYGGYTHMPIPSNMKFSYQPSMMNHNDSQTHSTISVPTTALGQIASIVPNGAVIYWQQQPSSVQASTSNVTIIDSSGKQTCVAVPAGSIHHGAVPTSLMASPMDGNNKYERGKNMAVRTDKGGGKANRAGKNKKVLSSGALDGSRSSVSNSVLEEFRSAKNRSWTISDIQGYVVDFCQDQNGSRFIQQRLEVADEYEKQLVITEILPSIKRLRNDVFGNYVVQKLLDHGTESMKADLQKTFAGEMLSLSMQMYGCRVVQKAFECLNDNYLPSLLAEFHKHVLTCIHDQNGNHVIQKCIEVMSNKAKMALAISDQTRASYFSNQIQFIVDCVLVNATTLSCHPYGCRVLQRILEHCIQSQKVLTLDVILPTHSTLLDDQYGNYVIQHVLQYGRNEDRESILSIIQKNGILYLSRQKFASNVVEKLLKYGNSSQRNAVVREMLQVVEDNGSNDEKKKSCVVLLMVRDAFANYVVQTTLDVVPEGEEKTLLLEELQRNAAQLRNYTFAKHIVAKLDSYNIKD